MIYWYFGILIVLVLLSQIPLLVIMGLFLFIVPGLVLILSNTVLLYSVLLLPLYAVRHSLRRHPFVALSALVPLAAVAILLPQYSQLRLDKFVATQTSEDFDRRKPITVKTLALGTNLHSWSSHRSNARTVCPEICQRLLFNREVEKIIMVRWGTRPSNNPPARTAYWIERKKSCDNLYTDQDDPLSAAVKARIAAGECLVAENDVDFEAVDSTAVEEILHAGNRFWDTIIEPRLPIDINVFTLQSIQRLSAFVGGLKSGEQILRQTVVSGAALDMPLHITTGGYGLDIKFQLARTSKVFNAGNLESILKQKFGFRLEPVTHEIDEIALAKSIVAQPADEATIFTKEQIGFIQNAMRTLGKRPLADDDIPLVRALIRDRRIDSAFALSGVFYPHAARLRILLPDFLDRLEADDIEKAGIRNTLNHGMRTFPSAELVQHAGRLIKIAQQAGDNPARASAIFGVIWRLGDLGPDTLPVIIPFLSHSNEQVRRSAATALCRMGAPVAESAIPALRNALSARKQKRHSASDDTRAIVRALVRLGDRKATEEIVAAQLQQPQTLTNELSLEAGFPRKLCERTWTIAE